ncbi:unnamed protein product [Notodromas monacha]|uniref:Sushi domain-containing protein 2 n=1 Tax=Notodromas monacha TaxID=399045 RepID=A0A7R9BLX2_9CRUS|nr:unnamed protein product [Notodromas monacha]CAG0917036.1 unnamed protein product [Notodromas monacha]
MLIVFLGLICALHSHRTSVTWASVPASDMYPSTGTSLPPCLDCNSAEIFFPTPFYYYSKPVPSCFVNNNGGISFLTARLPGFQTECDSTSRSKGLQLIAPFWARSNTFLGGGTSYLNTQSPSILEKAKNDVSAAFPGASGYNFRWALVVTWSQVPPSVEIASNGTSSPGPVLNRSSTEGTNTFQLVLTTDGINSFVIFYYNKIFWTKATNALFYARAGLVRYDGIADYSFNMAGSCTAAIAGVADGSNIGSPGKYVFQVDSSAVGQKGDCSGYNNNQLSTSIYPSSVGLYGGELVKLSGACVDANKTAQCAIDDPSYAGLVYGTAEAVSGTAVTCLTPILFRVGRVDIYFRFTATNGTVDTVVKPIFLNERPERTLTIAKRLVGNTINCDIKWDSAWFDGNNTVEIIHQPFDAAKAPTVLTTVANTGSTSIDASTFYTNTSTFIGDVGVRSSTGTLRPRVWANMEEFYSLFWPGGYEADCVTFKKNADMPFQSLSCPPTEQQAITDPRFLIDEKAPKYYHPGAKSCYSSLIPAVTSIQECCYNSSGPIICNDPPNGGTNKMVTPRSYYWLHFQLDIIPYYMCCENDKISQAANAEHCRGYYEKRPSDCGQNYRPRSGPPYLPLGARFGNTAAISTATVITAISFSCKSIPKVVVHFEPSPDGTNIKFYTKDGNELGITQTTALAPNLTISKISSGSYLISGLDVDLEAGLAGGAMWTNAFVSQAHKGKGVVKGLLGNFDDDPSNDLKPRTGNALSASADMQSIHYNFGESWRVTSGESTMVYVLGMTYEQANDASSFTPTFSVPDKSTFSAEVQQVCEDNEACYFDYQVSKDLTLAAGTKRTQEAFVKKTNVLFQQVSCPALADPANGRVKSTGVSVGSTATYACNDGFNITGSATMICRASGAWSGESAECSPEDSALSTRKWDNLNVWLYRVLDRLINGRSG